MRVFLVAFPTVFSSEKNRLRSARDIVAPNRVKRGPVTPERLAFLGILMIAVGGFALASCESDDGATTRGEESEPGAATDFDKESSGTVRLRVAHAFPGVTLNGTEGDLIARGEGPAGRLDVPASQGAHASVSVPSHANGATIVKATGTTVTANIELVGTRSVAGAVKDGVVAYEAAGPEGADLLAIPSTNGTEDFAVFWARPKSASLRYHLTPEGAGGLRVVRHSLEILDAAGVPRLRARRPWVVDAKGAKHFARLSIEGCAIDEGAGAPWARDFVQLDAASCDVVVAWDQDLSYPVLVDPEWTSAAVMSDERTHHTATLIGSGTTTAIAVIGGFDDSGAALSSIELFCPAENCGGTAAFTQLGITLATARGDHTETRLEVGTDNILVTGGRASRGATTSLASAERINLANQAAPALVAGVGAMTVGRDGHTATSLGAATGKVLIAGGEDNANSKTSSLFNPTTNAFEPSGSPPPTMSDHRRGHGAARLLDGRVLLTGGIGSLGLALSSAEIYDPVAGTFTATGSMTSQRAYATSTLFDGASGNVLVAGGTNMQGFYYSTADIYVASMGNFQQQPVVMQSKRAFHAATTILGQGTVLLSGGFNGTSVLDVTEVFNQGSTTFSLASAMNEPHNSHTATRLPSGKAVVIGGGVGGTALAPGSGAVLTNSAIQAEILLLSNGEPCFSDGECADAHCWFESPTDPEGMCCDRECGDICSSCLQAKKASATPDGSCDVVTDGTAVQAQCQNDVAFQLTCVSGQVTTSAVQKCEPYVCQDTSICRNKCSQDSHCDPDYFCGPPIDQPTAPIDCQKQVQQGTECDRARECASGFCVDGVCCNSACDSQCQACDVTGFVGVCVQVPSGPPHGDRPVCDGDGTGCAGECTTNTSACTYDKSKECGDSTCDAGSRSFGLCSVVTNGVCTPQTESCGDYACGGDGKCVSEGTCTSTSQCAGGAVCILSTGQCTVVTKPQCVEEHFVVSPDGTSKDCAPLKCDEAGCLRNCESVDDCVEGKVCDATGACVDPPPDPEPPSDCSAAHATEGHEGGALGAGAFVALLGLVSMRRRKKASVTR